MKYPFVLLYRNKEKYGAIDSFIETHKDSIQGTVYVISQKESLNRLFNPNYQILVTVGDDPSEYESDLFDKILPRRMQQKWIHMKPVVTVDDFNSQINRRFIENVIGPREQTRPVFSIFTTCYNSYDKIIRAHKSILDQVFIDWEWVIVDDSPDDKHFFFLRAKYGSNHKIRIYRRCENSGNIGNVKNEAISLCRGKYVLEMDHDDEILPDTLKDAVDAFTQDPDVGFVYMDYCNLYENGKNFKYPDFFGKGYCGYHCEKYNGQWVYVQNTPNINNVTVSSLISLPNHPRIWRKDVLVQTLGSYSEEMPISDDHEILLRTAVGTKIARVSKLAYVQYMNNNNNNFSLIRNGEINRISKHHLVPLFYEKRHLNDAMKELGAFEDEQHIRVNTRIWHRNNYEYKYCNKVVNPDHDKQYCIIGIEYLVKHLEEIRELYQNPRNGLILLDNRYNTPYLCELLDYYGLDKMKCYSLNESSFAQLEVYFDQVLKSAAESVVYTFKLPELATNTSLDTRFSVVNAHTLVDQNYLEIGVEYGHTFKNVHFRTKVGVDPDPKIDEPCLLKLTSDEFFKNIEKVEVPVFGCIFIDGMHHCDYAVNDMRNSLKCLSANGKIFMDDILPICYNEQLRVPIKHCYENNILKYREPWTGDVWKVSYYLLKHFSDSIRFKYFIHPNYRGIGLFQPTAPIHIPDNAIDEIMAYDFFQDYATYVDLVKRVGS